MTKVERTGIAEGIAALILLVAAAAVVGRGVGWLAVHVVQAVLTWFDV